LWWWPKVRIANIPKASRDLFERFGETVIGLVLAGGYTPRHPDLVQIYQNQDGTLLAQASDWLTERGDLRELRDQRLETVEWGLLILTFVGIMVAVALAWFHFD
jgi:hypothetical protein